MPRTQVVRVQLGCTHYMGQTVWVLVSDATPVGIVMLSCWTRGCLIPSALVRVPVPIPISIVIRRTLGAGRSLRAGRAGRRGRVASADQQTY